MWKFPGQRLKLELQLLTYTIARGNTRSLPSERGQGLNLHPHGYQSGSLPLSHNRNSLNLPTLKNVLFCFSLNRRIGDRHLTGMLFCALRSGSLKSRVTWPRSAAPRPHLKHSSSSWHSHSWQATWLQGRLPNWAQGSC